MIRALRADVNRIEAVLKDSPLGNVHLTDFIHWVSWMTVEELKQIAHKAMDRRFDEWSRRGVKPDELRIDADEEQATAFNTADERTGGAPDDAGDKEDQ